jgi:hypothetical protein
MWCFCVITLCYVKRGPDLQITGPQVPMHGAQVPMHGALVPMQGALVPMQGALELTRNWSLPEIGVYPKLEFTRQKLGSNVVLNGTSNTSTARDSMSARDSMRDVGQDSQAFASKHVILLVYSSCIFSQEYRGKRPPRPFCQRRAAVKTTQSCIGETPNGEDHRGVQ